MLRSFNAVITILLLPFVASAQSASDRFYDPLDVAQVQYVNDLYQKADKSYTNREFSKAASLYAQALSAGFDVPQIAYSAGSCFARAGDKARAFAYLHRAVTMGYIAIDEMKKDEDLNSLHDDPQWLELLQRVETNQHLAQEQATEVWDTSSIDTSSGVHLSNAAKIAGLSKFWAEIKYNFVYPERLAQLHWDTLYMRYIPKVLATKSTFDYYQVLAELCAKLRDSHTNVYPPLDVLGWVGLTTRLIEGHLMVVQVFDPALRKQGILPGMELVRIDAKPFRTYAAKNVSPYQSASSSQDLDVRIFEYFLLVGALRQPVQLTLQNIAGQRITRTVHRKPLRVIQALWHNPPGFEFRVLPGNVGYVALNSFDENAVADQFFAAFDSIAKTRALILDLRENGGGNSGVGWRILSALIEKPVSLEFWQTRDYKPLLRAWASPINMLSAPGGDLAPDTAHHYANPIVMLIGPRTFSAAEDFVVGFDQSGRGTLMGQRSAGSTGQPLNFKLPAGGSGRICTWRGTYPTGKQFLGIGVRPQIVVSGTLQDFRAGRDTVLDAAVSKLKHETGD